MESDSKLEPLPSTPEERTWAMAAHLSALSGHLVPLGHIVAPLVIWIMKRDTLPLVADQAKEAVNAQICYTIYFAVAFLLSLVVIGLPFLFAIYLGDFILIIVAAIAANEGKRYRYPWVLRLVK